MRVPKIIWKHNLLIHSSSSRAGDPVQWSNFPQQQDALEKKFSTTWSTLFCCSLWKSPFYFLSYPIQILEQQFWFWSVHSKPFSWRNRIFLCEKEIQMSVLHVRLVCSFICFDVVSPFTVVPPSLTQRKRGGGAFMPRKKQGGKTGIRFSEIELGMRMVTMAIRKMCICC